MKFCLLFLTCANKEEADKISKALLEKRLVVCIKKLPVSSDFLWQGKINHAEEIMMVMDSVEENFSKVEKIVTKLHSYETFVLTSVPVSKTTKAVENWVKSMLE